MRAAVSARSATWAALAATALSLSPGAAGQTGPSPRGAGSGRGGASTHIIVKFAPGVVDARSAGRARGSARAAGRRMRAFKTGIPAGLSDELRAQWRRCGVLRMRPLYLDRFTHPAVAARHGLQRTYVLEVPPGSDCEAIAAAFRRFKKQVEFAEVDAYAEVAAIPNDAGFCEQYGMHNTGLDCDQQPRGVADADIDAPEAWDIHTGNPGTVTIAIIDSGVDPHPEFAGRLVPGWNVAEDNDNTTDDCPHGTHVAGIAAAAGNNNIGVAGVTWGANIMPVRVFAGFNPCGGLASTIADGIRWAVDQGADICNLSIQVDDNAPGLQFLEDAVNYAHDNGVLVVSAAGNTIPSGIGIVKFPARYANSMAVSATNAFDTLASFSNFGNELDVGAPGDDIWSTWPLVCDGGSDDGLPCSDGLGLFCAFPGTCTRRVSTYGFLSGTSMATPHVSGLAALLKSFVPTLTSVDLRRIITSSADDLGPPGWDNEFGSGRINAHNALLMAMSLPRIFASAPPAGAIDAGEPSDPDGVMNEGWSFVDLDFIGDTSGLSCLSPPCTDFLVTQADGGAAPDVLAVIASPPPLTGWMRVILTDPITPGTWTTIEHTPSGTSVRLGFLSGDTDGDGIVAEADLSFLKSALTGSLAPPPPSYQVDIDRSGSLTPADLLREIDLFNGGGPYDVFLGATLPPPP